MSAEPSHPNSAIDLPADWWRRLGHDLREPIAPMRMAVQLLRSEFVAAADRDDALQLIDRQIDQLVAHVDDVSDILRLSAGVFVLNPVEEDLNLLLDIISGRAALRKRLDGKQLALHCVATDSAIVARHDPVRLAALLEYLVGKSAEHAVPGGALSVELRRSTDRALFRIFGANGSLAAEPDLLHVTGAASGTIEHVQARAILMKELARLSGVTFSSIDAENGIAFWMPISQP